MIGAVHEALRSMLYGDGKIPASDVDITFATPTRDWVAAISRPTINFNLYALVENVQYRESEFMRHRQDVREARRLRPRRIDLRYVITTHFKSQMSELEDEEWSVLWRVLATLLRNTEWPSSLIPAEARALDVEVQSQTAQADGAPRVSEVFNSLGIPPRPALHYVVTVPIDLNVEYQRTLVVGLGMTLRDPSGRLLETTRRYAWTLLNAQGQPVPGVEVRVPDGPGFSVSSEGGLFTTQLPHDEITQLLMRRPNADDWEIVRVTSGVYDVVLP